MMKAVASGTVAVNSPALRDPRPNSVDANRKPRAVERPCEIDARAVDIERLHVVASALWWIVAAFAMIMNPAITMPRIDPADDVGLGRSRANPFHHRALKKELHVGRDRGSDQADDGDEETGLVRDRRDERPARNRAPIGSA